MITISQKQISKLRLNIVLLLLIVIALLISYEKVSTPRLVQQIAKASCILIFIYEIIINLGFVIKDKTSKGVLIFFCMLFFYSIISENFKMFFACSFTLLSYPFFLIHTRNGNINNRNLSWFLFLYAIVVIYQLIFSVKENISTLYINEYNYGVLNIGYNLALLMLLFFFFKKNRRNLILIILCFIFVALSRKRGALICGTISLLLYVISYAKQNKYHNANKYLQLMFFVGLLVFFTYKFQTLFFGRIFDDIQNGISGSGRDQIYTTFIRLWSEGSILELIFGNGFYSTLNVFIGGAYRYAHSDYVELLYDHGIFGLFIYLFMFFQFYFRYYKIRKNYNRKLYGFIAVLLVFIVKGLLSGVYLDVAAVLLMLPMAIYCGSIYNNKIILSNF